MIMDPEEQWGPEESQQKGSRASAFQTCIAASTLAPLSSSSLATPMWLFFAALCSPVMPFCTDQMQRAGMRKAIGVKETAADAELQHPAQRAAAAAHAVGVNTVKGASGRACLGPVHGCLRDARLRGQGKTDARTASLRSTPARCALRGCTEPPSYYSCGVQD